jgi:hypothetical protein
MNHWTYIGMAYGAFAALMLWDYWIASSEWKQTLRRIRLQQRRSAP